MPQRYVILKVMGWTVTIVLAAGLLLAVPDAHARKPGAAAPAKPNRVDISYVEPEAVAYQPVYRALKERQALEKVRDLLSPLRLPRRLLLQTKYCDGRSNAWSNEEGVTVCYEYIDDIWKKAPKETTPAGIAPIDTVVGPFLDVFLHEVAHSVFAVLKIPVLGREEDAADQFSTYIMLKFDKEEARRLILGSAYQYKDALSLPSVTMKQHRFADQHGTPAQRFFNLLCVAYGNDPDLFADLIEKGFLPEERAVGCKHEYVQLAHAFDTLIGPHIDQGVARTLHKRWLPPVTTKPKPWRNYP
jgi:hypothetical protein